MVRLHIEAASRREFCGQVVPALALAAVALVSLLPFLVAAIPSMGDWPGHVGRYHVMLHVGEGGPLARFYAFDWRLVGNLGVDLAERAIGPWLGAERAAWWLTALLPPLTVAGLAAVSCALYGRVQPTAVLAAAFVLGNPFLFGFLNYCLAFALALLAFAGWIALARRSLAVRLAAMTPAVLLVWLAHAMGWAVLALLVAGFEGEALWRARRRPGPALARAAAMAVAFVPPVVLTLAWSRGGAAALSGYGASPLVRKAMNWVVMLRGGEPVIDIAATLIVAAAAAWLVARRRVRIDWRIGAGAVLLVLAVMVVPTTLLGSWGADERLAPAAAMAMLLSLRWRDTAWGTPAGARRAGAVLSLAALLLIGVRTAVIAVGWHRLDARYGASLAALDRVPRGARIAVLVFASDCRAGWRQTAWPHLAALAIPRRDALVNVEWPLAGAPLLRVVAPLPADWRDDPSQMVDAFDCAGRPKPASWHARLAALPAGAFDVVWLLDTHGIGDPWPGHRPVHVDGDSALYALPAGKPAGAT